MYRLAMHHYILIMSLVAAVRGITVKEFERVSAKRGAPLRCGVACGRDPLCTGYMSTPGPQHVCTTLTDGALPGECFAEASDPLAAICYGKVAPVEVGIDTTPQATSTEVATTLGVDLTFIEPCVETARQSLFGGVYVSYLGQETMYKFPSTGDCFLSQAYVSRSWSAMYFNFPQDIRDMYKVMASFTEYLVVLDGKWRHVKGAIWSCSVAVIVKMNAWREVTMLILILNLIILS
jgi:hypothetical protein